MAAQRGTWGGHSRDAHSSSNSCRVFNFKAENLVQQKYLKQNTLLIAHTVCFVQELRSCGSVLTACNHRAIPLSPTSDLHVLPPSFHQWPPGSAVFGWMWSFDCSGCVLLFTADCCRRRAPGRRVQREVAIICCFDAMEIGTFHLLALVARVEALGLSGVRRRVCEESYTPTRISRCQVNLKLPRQGGVHGQTNLKVSRLWAQS